MLAGAEPVLEAWALEAEAEAEAIAAEAELAAEATAPEAAAEAELAALAAMELAEATACEEIVTPWSWQIWPLMETSSVVSCVSELLQLLLSRDKTLTGLVVG